MSKADYFARDIVTSIPSCLDTPPWLHRKKKSSLPVSKNYLPLPNSVLWQTTLTVTDYHVLLEKSAPAPRAK